MASAGTPPAPVGGAQPQARIDVKKPAGHPQAQTNGQIAPGGLGAFPAADGVFGPLALPGLPLVVAFFIIRDAFYSISNPIRNQLAMETTIAQERGTTAGFTHMTFDVGGAFGAGMAGALIGVGVAEASPGVDVARFVPAFLAAGLLVLGAGGLYSYFFQNWDGRPQPVVEPVDETVVAATGN